MPSAAETNSINRVLKSWGLGSLEEPGSVQALAYMVQDHEHFSELLRACEPELRRHMYEAMSPNLRFPPNTLDWYLTKAKQHAETMQFPTLEADGTLKQYYPPEAGVKPPLVIDIPEFELWLQCARCQKESFFYAERKVDAIAGARDAGWAWDEYELNGHICPNCLDEVGYALDAKTGQEAPE